MARLLVALALLSAPVVPLPATTPAGPPPAKAPAAAPAAAQGAVSPPPSPAPLPPALGPAALRDELRASSQKRQEELAALARDRAALEKLAADISAARAALEAETARLDEKAKKAAKTDLEQAPGAGPGRDEARASSPEALARTLKGMKPETAASLLGRLERPLAMRLLRRMRPGDAGAVLERMKPDAAAELFALMAARPGAGGTP